MSIAKNVVPFHGTNHSLGVMGLVNEKFVGDFICCFFLFPHCLGWKICYISKLLDGFHVPGVNACFSSRPDNLNHS